MKMNEYDMDKLSANGTCYHSAQHWFKDKNGWYCKRCRELGIKPSEITKKWFGII